MRNWRELGEVPDSDDEDDDVSLDNPESQEQDEDKVDLVQEICQAHNQTSNDTPVDHDDPSLANEKPQTAKNVDVWDLPSSPPDQPSLAALPTLLSMTQLPRGKSPQPDQPPTPEDRDPTPRPDKQPTPEVLPFLQDEISTGHVRTTNPEPRFSPAPLQSSQLSSLSSPESELSRPRPVAPKAQEEILPENLNPQILAIEQELSRQTATQTTRSFRPRKPIQQHPYLVDEGRYSSLLRSHGLRPIKVVASSQPVRRRTEEEDSQDQEFRTEESQETSQAGLGQDNDDSPLLALDDETSDRDELAPSPSPSPPKTSPGDRHLRTSSQPSNGDQTDMTSISGDDEFPSVDRLKPQSAKRGSRKLKRQPSQLLSEKLKRQKVTPRSGSPHRGLIVPADIYDLPSSAESQPPPDQSQDLGNTPRSPLRNRAVQPSSALRGVVSAITTPEDSNAADFTILGDGDEPINLSDSEPASSAEHSRSDQERLIARNKRSIHNVLPASWLRLDQQNHRSAVVRNRRQTPEPIVGKTPRRGVAVPKHSTPGPSTLDPFIFNDSEESDNGPTTAQPRRLGVPASHHNNENLPIFDADGASVVEDDHIDYMLPGRKRAASSNLFRKNTKKRTKSTFGKSPGQLTRQPKITQVLGRSKSASHGTSLRHGVAKIGSGRAKGTSTKHASRKRAATPPLLSILDVLEPAAPKFIKIAARTARKKPNLGKSSPSKKMISLAARRDNVDALSTLQEWKAGKTRPKIAAPPAKPRDRDLSRTALSEIPVNRTTQSPWSHTRDFFSHIHKAARQSDLDEFVTANPNELPQAPPESIVPIVHKRKLVRKRATIQPRPAQLEINGGESDGRRLAAKKRSLDALFRKNRKSLDTLSNPSLSHSFHDLLMVREDRNGAEGDKTSSEATPTIGIRAKDNTKSRFRKSRAPQCIDLEAPQYERANDPLPPVIVSNPEEFGAPENQDKLKGLGPYGTHYTQHFEVFPLERGTFFHESTIIGRGYITKATEDWSSAKIQYPRPAVSFVLDEQVLRWGPWNDKTSSELGILFDWIAEQMEPDKIQDTPWSSSKTVDAANFVLDYILGSLSIHNDAEQVAFVLRCVEIWSNFVTRFGSFDWSTAADQTKIALLEVLVRFLVALLPIQALSQAPGSGQSMRVESLLTQVASLIIKGLLDRGLEEMRMLCSDLQRLSAREQGIRPRQVAANCWVVVMRVLEHACIPRGSFWDVTQAVMLKSGAASGLDTRVFEHLWQDMFTLLPLGEIDDSGILIPGLRNTSPLEGWTLPQQLMKRVFQVYKLNPQQPPSFNEYCRALVARCHFLVQLWGWRKCTSIIGTIFDFFGSQSLAHLRNEEVYKSPRFLEELHRNPSLSIEPEDRCFHIFIKMLGIVIRRLRQLGRQNEVKNLVTRTLPNHNRQYLKEDTIHQHDLAALRNHHDLLCTLFWAAPPDRRPPVHLIEKLVTPSRAHKEACVINIKAWNHLARFVVLNGEGAEVFKPFASWRNNIFNHVLDSYLSAASDIEQQFRELSEQMKGISAAMRDAMIAKNKATAMDVLHSSLKASLDVLQHAPTLQATLYSLNITQLQKVFTSLDYRSPGFDWSVLRLALETLELYLGRLDEASEEHYSSDFAENVDPNQLADATLLLEEQLAKDFFWMARTTLGLPLKKSAKEQTEQTVCAEKTVTLASRIAVRFINNGVTQLLPFFAPGKFSLFPDTPKNLHGPERRFLPLFTATLVKNHMFDFKSIESNILELWILSIIKPLRFLEYENYLAEILQRQNVPFLERATVLVGVKPDYNSNIAYFSSALHHMRRSLREAGSSRAKHDRDEYARVLNLAMRKLEDDLALLRQTAEPPQTTTKPKASSLPTSEHAAYVAFVRQVISLIKSHGVGICVVDPFFTQPSLDYSPPLQDPAMHTAGIVAYGVRLAEKEPTAVPQLFHYLYNNFKIALGNGRLDQECEILVRAMRDNRSVAAFVMQHMVPAVVQVSASGQAGSGEVWILLETYVAPLVRLFTGRCVPRELRGWEEVEHAVGGVLASVLGWFGELRVGLGSSSASLSTRQLYVANLLVMTANALRPALRCWLGQEEAAGDGYDDAAAKQKEMVRGVMDSLTSLFADAHSHITEVMSQWNKHRQRALEGEESYPALPVHPQSVVASMIRVGELLTGLPPPRSPSETSLGLGSARKNQRQQDFVRHIAADVPRSWIVTEGLVTVKMAGTGGGGGGAGAVGGRLAGTQQTSVASSQAGTKVTLGDSDELVKSLYAGLGEWILDMGAASGKDRSRRRNRGCSSRHEDLIF